MAGGADRPAGRRRRLQDYTRPAPRPPGLRVRGGVAVPLTSAGEVLGDIGLASGDVSRPFTSARSRRSSGSPSSPRSRSTTPACSSGRRPRSVERAHAALHDVAHRAAEPDPPAHPPRRAARARSAAATTGRRRRGGCPPDRADPDGPRPVQGRQREPRPRRGRPPPRRGRRAAAAPRRGPPTRSRGWAPTSSASCSGRCAASARPSASRRGSRPPSREPFDLDGREVNVGASLGLAVGRAVGALPGRPAQAGRDRAPPGEGGPGPTTILFDPEMHAQTARPGDPRARPAAGPRPLRAPAPLPAARRPRDRDRRRAGGAPPLAPPGPRARPAAVVHPARRGDGAHPPDRPLGARDRVHQVRDWQRRLPGGGRPRRSASTCPRASSRRRASCRRRRDPRQRGLDPARWSWRSPRACVMDQSEASSRAAPGRCAALGVKLVARRLRDGLLVARLPAAAAAGHDQDRPVVRLGARRRRRPTTPIVAGGHLARPRPGDRASSPRASRPGAARAPARPRLRPRPGLLVLAAAAGAGRRGAARRDGRAARGARRRVGPRPGSSFRAGFLVRRLSGTASA